uniref:Uncharacterized protein n=1 Tax=Pongo abelii TaxID=9601 RepID=A0A8I5TTB3_PONAB
MGMPGSRPTSTWALMGHGQCLGVPSPRPPTGSHRLEDANVSFTGCTGTNSPTQDGCDEVALPVNLVPGVPSTWGPGGADVTGVYCAAALVLCQPHPCGDHRRHTPLPPVPGRASPRWTAAVATRVSPWACASCS